MEQQDRNRMAQNILLVLLALIFAYQFWSHPNLIDFIAMFLVIMVAILLGGFVKKMRINVAKNWDDLALSSVGLAKRLRQWKDLMETREMENKAGITKEAEIQWDPVINDKGVLSHLIFVYKDVGFDHPDGYLNVTQYEPADPAGPNIGHKNHKIEVRSPGQIFRWGRARALGKSTRPSGIGTWLSKAFARNKGVRDAVISNAMKGDGTEG